jgi:hypothetical protein
MNISRPHPSNQKPSCSSIHTNCYHSSVSFLFLPNWTWDPRRRNRREKEEEGEEVGGEEEVEGDSVEEVVEDLVVTSEEDHREEEDPLVVEEGASEVEDEGDSMDNINHIVSYFNLFASLFSVTTKNNINRSSQSKESYLKAWIPVMALPRIKV